MKAFTALTEAQRHCPRCYAAYWHARGRELLASSEESDHHRACGIFDAALERLSEPGHWTFCAEHAP